MVLAQKYRSMLASLSRETPEATVRELVKKIRYYGGPTLETQVVRLSEVKKYFKTRFPDFVPLVEFPKDLIERVQSNRAKKLVDRENFTVTEEDLAILQRRETIVEKAAWALFVSGRRVSELSLSGFEEAGDRIMSRSLKKKRKRSPQYFSLLPGVSPGEWLSIVSQVRAAYSGLEVNSINRKISRYLKSAVRADMSAHKLRGIYANLMWHASGRKQIKTGFIKKILNLESQEIAINYSSFIIAK